MTGPVPSVLSQHERQALTGWLADESASPQLEVRARILLMSADGVAATTIAKTLGVGLRTVYRWRRRYRAGGIAAMGDRPRPGRPRALGDDQRAELVRLTRQCIPAQGKQWSVRSLARHAGVSEWQVREAWRRAGLTPDRPTRRHGVDDALASRVDGLIGLYIAPPDNIACFSVSHPLGGCVEHAARSDSPMAWKAPPRHSPTSVYRAFDTAHAISEERGDRVAYDTGLEFLRELRRRGLLEPNTYVVVDDNGAPGVHEVAKFVTDEVKSALCRIPMTTAWVRMVERCLGRLEHPQGVWSSIALPGPYRREIRRYVVVGQEHARAPFVWIGRSNAVFVCNRQARSSAGGDSSADHERCASIAHMMGSK